MNCDLKNYTFPGFKSLNLSKSSIKEFEYLTKNYGSFKTIDLSGNQLKAIKVTRTIHTLNLSFNQIQHVNISAEKHLIRIDSLDLSYNNIVSTDDIKTKKSVANNV